ncbi:MAG: site-2 protease family protein [Clostridia bacterium]
MARKINRLKMKIHPLSAVIGCILILTGNGGELLVYMSTLLIHEYAHYIVATNCGGSLKSTYITPFGAKLEAELFDLTPIDELKVALAGPAVNLLVVVTLYASWWLYPVTYPYTEYLANVNLAIATVNLFPAYPLDGGRVLNVVLKLKLKDKAEKIVQIFGICSSVILAIIFIATIKTSVNATLLMMSVFMFLGSVVDLKKDNKTRKMLGNALGGLDIQGKEVKKVTVELDNSLYELVKMLDNAYFFEFDVYEKNEKITTINEIKLKKWLLENSYNEKLKKLVK